MDGIFFHNAMTFLSINAIMTYFLNELGAATFEIGLANALVSIGAIASQPFFAQKVMNLSYKLHTFVKYLFIQRTLFLLFVLTIPVFSVSNPQLMILLFFVFWALFNFFVGAYGPFYMTLFAKMVGVQQRGRLRGYSGGLGNLLALGSAYAASVILNEVAYPYNYTIIFGIGAIILLFDVLCFALMKEEPDQVTPIDMNFFQYFKSIPVTFRENRTFKTIVISFCFMMISQVSLAYYALYAVRVYEISASQAVLFTAITGLINIIGNIVFGIIADKYSHRLVLLVSSLCAVAAGVLIVSIYELFAVYAAFALSTLGFCGFFLSSGVLIIENVKHERLAMYVSVNSVLTLIVSAVVTLGSSFLIDIISFESVFIVAGVSGLVSGIILFNFNRLNTKIKEPFGTSSEI
ncbi:MFS transporter [Paenibacillus abyssi]